MTPPRNVRAYLSYRVAIPRQCIEPVEATLNGVAVPVDFRVELRWPSAVRAFGFASCDLVATFGNRVRDPHPG